MSKILLEGLLLGLQMASYQIDIPSGQFIPQLQNPAPVYAQAKKGQPLIERLLMEGDSHLKQGRYDKAIDIYKQAYDLMKRVPPSEEVTNRVSFSLCKAYFNKAYNEIHRRAELYTFAVEHCENVMKSSAPQNFKRETLSYLGMAFWDTDPIKADRLFKLLTEDEINDGLREHAYLSRIQIQIENKETEGYLKIANDMLNELKKNFPSSKFINVAEELIEKENKFLREQERRRKALEDFIKR